MIVLAGNGAPRYVSRIRSAAPLSGIKLREFLLRNMPALGMLVPYFFTVVLGNLIYASPWGRDVLKATGYPLDLLSFNESFTLGFFALLFLPFALVPPAFWLSRKATYRFKPWLSMVPEIGRPEYVIATVAAMVYVGFVFWRGGIAAMFGHGSDALSSVEARFQILKTIGLWPMIALHSVLWFLSLYAFVRATRDRQWFWRGSAAISCVFVTICLTLLNMKWPVLIYFLALLIAAFTFSKRPIISSAVWAVILVVAYVGVTASALRVTADHAFILPSQQVVESSPEESAPGASSDASTIDDKASALSDNPKSDRSWAARYLSSLSASALTLAANPFSRMAVPFSYYYHVFTEEGRICGGPFSQIMRDPPCVPTWMIYTKIFPQDKQFAGRGTSPAAVNITAYALGGWTWAILETLLAGIVLGIFAGLPLQSSAVLGALFITGSIVGYHFSQVPGEGPIIYNYGMGWSFAVLLLLLAVTTLRKRWASSREERSN